MTKRNLLGLCLMATAMALPISAFAQDASETAVILSGTGSTQARASRSLGTAVSGSIDSATSVIRSATPTRNRAKSRRSRRGAPSVVTTVIGTGDALEGTDASAYQVDNGATIKVSGGFRPSAATRCTENCEADAPE